MISILILTKNEEQDLPACLESVKWCDDVHLFDSFSTDKTVEIAQKAGAKVTQRVFDNWSAHQNWGLANLPFKYPWVLYIDADERVSPELHEATVKYVAEGAKESAFRIQRRDFYLDGTWLKHAQISPLYIRLFRPSQIRYERLVNPITHVDGPIGELKGFLDHYPFSKGIGFWLERHIKYAKFEAEMKIEETGDISNFSLKKALFARDWSEKRRHQKLFFYRLPLRPLFKWVYMIGVRRAFLDGSAGTTYAMLQCIYEYFIVLNERELRRKKTIL